MKWFYKSGELHREDWDVHVDVNQPPLVGWKHTGIRVGILRPGVWLHIAADDNERILFLLEGEGMIVKHRIQNQQHFETQNLRGRESVFHDTADHLYLPRRTEIEISGDGRVAIGEALANEAKPVQVVTKENVPVFVRGAGRESREVRNLGMPENLDADRIMVVEVVVPAGNWSGAPAHKHDVYIPGKESHLEEIYYFELAVTKGANVTTVTDPVGYFRGYASDERAFDVTAEVRSGDLVLIPHGWHGPVAANPGYDLYFFNVMAGPDVTREWNATDDPHHEWIRESWKTQLPDPRLPYVRKAI